jgi:enoyl-CoA hydratase/carnithine racemase
MAKARFTSEGDVGEIAIADPPLNLFGLELARDLASAVDEARDSAARAVLVRSEGDNFSAGANVEIFLGRDEAAARELIEEFMPAIRRSRRSRCRPSRSSRDSASRRGWRSRSAAT